MGILKKFISKLQGRIHTHEPGYWVYVKCNRCGEVIRSRIDLFNDLSINYGDNEQAASEVTYFCRKTLIGSKRCFQPIEVELTFNNQRELIHRQIRGGIYINEADYLASQ